MTKTKTVSVAELREQAQALGVTVPAKATKPQITKLIQAHEQGSATEPKAKQERRKIETTTDRGDWTDPFSGLVVAAGNDVNPRNNVRRDGDEAVLTTYA